MKRALIISCFDWYEKRLKPIKECLEDMGYLTEICISDFDHIGKKKVEIKREECTYVSVPSYSRNFSFERIWSHIKFGKEIKKKIDCIKPELIYLLLPPNNTAYYCSKYTKNNPNVKYFVDIIDMWPESMPMGGLKKTLVYDIWAQLRNKNIWNANRVFTECSLYQKKLREYGISNDMFSTLYLYKELNDSDKELVQAYMAEYNQRAPLTERKKCVLGYLGSINHIIAIDQICKLISDIRGTGYEVEVQVVGDGENREAFLDGLKRAGATVFFHGLVYDEKTKIEILSQCDYGINMMKSQTMIGLTTKSIDYFSYGIPVINNVPGDTWELVEKEKIGINYTVGIENKVTKMDIKNMREKVFACFNHYFSKNAFTRNLREGLK